MGLDYDALATLLIIESNLFRRYAKSSLNAKIGNQYPAAINRICKPHEGRFCGMCDKEYCKQFS